MRYAQLRAIVSLAARSQPTRARRRERDCPPAPAACQSETSRIQRNERPMHPPVVRPIEDWQRKTRDISTRHEQPTVIGVDKKHLRPAHSQRGGLKRDLISYLPGVAPVACAEGEEVFRGTTRSCCAGLTDPRVAAIEEEAGWYGFGLWRDWRSHVQPMSAPVGGSPKLI